MAVGALKDDEVDFVKVTTANLLRAIVDKLLQCQDYKVKDMARRYEILILIDMTNFKEWQFSRNL